ncbi:DNA replication initiation control protein YabA [Lacticaseibacillus pabuli]|uniref:DNA replication initiation control protein YabA n=1 Tax=Lacticaseibacillus pabuli TaxID=3025672 RepID=A0ABY7WWI7_9LACO|nr:DNA replication initiation control protein YabA [Lacticaseibacillus sp. KACC 23028]WDF83346.1 DNA replication initiation control protein YabA [Lacticaseibacillus sp. KACC 23028]
MAKNDLFEQFLDISDEAEQFATRLKALKEEVTKLLEQNAELRMENQSLHERVEELTAKGSAGKQTKGMTKSKQNLQKIYEEGYHVCSKFYGQHLEPGESCAFCLDILYGDR